MKSAWVNSEAQAAVEHYARHGVGEDFALRVYTTRLLGREPRLVLHGGGNTSVKTEMRDLLGEEAEVLCVKGSGWDMAAIEPAGLPAVRRADARAGARAGRRRARGHAAAAQPQFLLSRRAAARHVRGVEFDLDTSSDLKIKFFAVQLGFRRILTPECRSVGLRNEVLPNGQPEHRLHTHGRS